MRDKEGKEIKKKTTEQEVPESSRGDEVECVNGVTLSNGIVAILEFASSMRRGFDELPIILTQLGHRPQMMALGVLIFTTCNHRT